MESPQTGITLIIVTPTLKGCFLARRNRFLVAVKVKNRPTLAHLPNPGRMKELLHRGASLVLVRKEGRNRKTRYEVLGIVKGREKILLDTRLSNDIAEEAIRMGRISPLRGYSLVRREFTWVNSRFDFLLSRRGSKCIVEVKASTLLRGSVALFPDAPTARGRKHLMTLTRAKHIGYRTCVLFMVHRIGATSFAPNANTDPRFSQAFWVTRAAGVEAYAYECRWERRSIRVARRIPIPSSLPAR